MTSRILIVEDDLVQSSLLSGLLASHKHYVDTAANGLEALRKVRNGCFDLVLMDQAMPEVNGLAAARLIADTTPPLERPKMIALTGAPDEAAALASGGEPLFDAVLPKPWDRGLLLATVESCLKTASLRRRHHPEDPAPRPPAPRPAGSTRVLIVEGDDLVRDMMKLALEANGCIVEGIGNGLDALRNITAQRYDVVIADDQIPEINGVTMAKLVFDLVLRADRPRLIAFTANPQRFEDPITGAASLFDHVIPKSNGFATLIAAVRECAEYGLRPKPEAINVISLAQALIPSFLTSRAIHPAAAPLPMPPPRPLAAVPAAL